jgi:C4-dicarboxylate-specific signal transduction histidine kinase
VRITYAPVGLTPDDLLIAGSDRFDFPTEAQRLLLRTGANQAAIAVDRWRAETGAAIPCQVDWFRIDDPRTGLPMNIATVSTDLRAQKRSEADLRDLNETLEHRVAERTAELAKANEWLLAEKTEREHADARLQELQLELFHAARLSLAGQMAAALAHELNQPLTVASNFINAARRVLANGELQEAGLIREDMNEAAREVLRAGQIMRRLRDFARRGDTDKRLESTVKMIEEASALALTGAGALGIDLRFRFDPNAPLVLADRVQIQQVLVNLMRNALEAMANSRRRELTVTTARLDEEPIEIAVADSGSGLPKDMVDQLFEPFVSTKRHGMGLGLSICRTIVESNGGRIKATENPGGGVLFSFTLAAAPGNHDHDSA